MRHALRGAQLGSTAAGGGEGSGRQRSQATARVGVCAWSVSEDGQIANGVAHLNNEGVRGIP